MPPMPLKESCSASGAKGSVSKGLFIHSHKSLVHLPNNS